jgi:hypothetical protein
MEKIHGKKFQENIRNFSNKKTDQTYYLKFTFQGSKNTAHKKTWQNMLSKKAVKFESYIVLDIILLNKAIYSSFYFLFLLKKVHKSKFSSKVMEIFW